MHILDGRDLYKRFDPQHAFEAAALQPAQLAHDFELTGRRFDREVLTSVVLAGMGGSALAGDFAHSWPELGVPFVVCRDYALPAFVGPYTLVICSSYSGSTEETLSVMDDAERRGAQIAVIAHGKALAEHAQERGYMFAHIPEALQPRMAVFYGYRALAELLVAAGLAQQRIIKELESIIKSLQAAITQWAPDVPYEINQAKQLAEHLVGKTPIIYAGPKLYPAAYKWKINVNENAKNTAWCGMLSEFDHNEFIGWSGLPIEKPFGVVDLVSAFEHPRVQRRFDIADRLLSGMRPQPKRVIAEGDSLLHHLLWIVLLGDYTTLYLAMLNGVNPAPVELVEKFKRELNQPRLS